MFILLVVVTGFFVPVVGGCEFEILSLDTGEGVVVGRNVSSAIPDLEAAIALK